MRRSHPLRLSDYLLLLVPAAALAVVEWIPGSFGSEALRLLTLAAAASVWFVWAGRGRRPARERWMIFGCGLAAVMVLLVAAGREFLASRESRGGAASLAAAYTAYWGELESRAGEATNGFEAHLAAVRDPGMAFDLLHRARSGSPLQGLTLLLVDGEGDIVAWAGRGLVQEPEGPLAERPFAGVLQSYAAATAWVSSPVRGARGVLAWIVAGESRSTNAALPLLPATVSPDPLVWGFLRSEGADAPTGHRVESTGHPALVFSGPLVERGGQPSGPALHWVAGFLALGLFGLAALRGLGTGVLAGTVLRRPGGTSEAVILLAAAAGLLALAFRISRDAIGFPALAALLFLGLAVAARRRSDSRSGLVAAGAVLLLAGAAWHDHGLVAPILAAVGLVVCASSVQPVTWKRPSSLLVSGLIALLAAATFWQYGLRERLAESLPERLAALAPPSEEILHSTDRRLERHFRAFDLAAIAAGAQPDVDSPDLAYALWRESPLARVDAASALVVELEESAPSSFAYGLPLADDLELDRAPARWESVAPTAWRALERHGEGSLISEGRRIGLIRWSLVPRPGFGVRDAAIRDLPTTLLGAARSSELAAVRTLALPPETGVEVVIYGGGGEIELSPWREGTPQLAALRDRWMQGRPEIESPVGPARFALREAPATSLALVAPRLGPLAGLERVGAQFARALGVVVAIAALALLLSLPRTAARDLLSRLVRSYSKRLILVYSLLLLLPLLLLYTLLSESLGRRVEEEQRVAADAALTSAERVLGEYVLSLEPGFGLTTALDDDLLVWLSRVVRHEIHLYWNGEIYASSQRELFAAGFLPRRVPGEVWRAVTLGGERLTSRTTRAGAASYVELYSPLRIPGMEALESGLLLSMPLLAQQEESTAEVALIRRRTLLATLAAFLLLAGLGTRLASSLTRPITDLVAGTRRIAAGAEALGVKPGVDELSALAEAIDQMARRIAEGRSQLLREKRLVDGIVEGVTSGVVCVDRSGVVLLANRQARRLLDVEPGESLVGRLGPRPELREVVKLLDPPRKGIAQMALRGALGDSVERDWSLVWVPMVEPDGPGGLLVVEDVSEVIRAQRLEAWAEMARIIAHEIKNPLTPIRLSTEHLRDAWQRDREHFESVFERCTINILRQVEELREIASDFSIYSHIPKSERQPGDLVANLRPVVESYRSGAPSDVDVVLTSESPAIEARFDPKLLGRALRNLIENALRVSAAGGRVEVGLSVDPESQNALIRVADEGPGVPEAVLARIFEPYFSTHAGGTGLGLPIALRIAQEHGGSIRARNRPTGGLEVVITIPLG
ncbi:MAG: ATP-binding protein [Thermoanaerobaculia bacterium]